LIEMWERRDAAIIHARSMRFAQAQK
jgi:hypothetical protein